MKIAFATDNGESFNDNHFGDSAYYYIYEMTSSGVEFIKNIKNTTEEDNEDIHADPRKAKGVTEMLKMENIQVVVSKVFGPNIKRIKKKFVCILMNDADISDSVKKAHKNIEVIQKEWEEGETRNHINLQLLSNKQDLDYV